jgi:hypothetical protein
MTVSVRDLLRAFDAISSAEQQQVAAEILRRWVAVQISHRWTSRDLLRAFDALSSAEQQQMATEILRRWVAVEILHRWTSYEGMTDEALDELAAGVFRGDDAEMSEGITASIPNGTRHELSIREGLGT